MVTGRVVESVEVSERFLWDLRRTVSDLLVANYAGRFRELAHQHGLRLTIEAYDGAPCDEMTYAGQADEPMAEFWSWGFNTAYSCTEMASAAHVYGKRILGAEAFTANDGEKWLHHPASIKALGDWAFCEGINRFVFHRYALQPWRDYAPGMSMGPWGLHYERTQTWWEQSAAWHEYLARCQFMLRQGLFVADIFPGTGRLAEAFLAHSAGRLRQYAGAAALQLRRLHARGGAHAHEGQGREAGPARRHELSPAGVAAGRDDDASAVAQDQGAGAGRRHGPRPAAREIPEPGGLSELRCRGAAARGRDVGGWSVGEGE